MPMIVGSRIVGNMKQGGLITERWVSEEVRTGCGDCWQLLFCSPDQDWDKIYTPEFQLQHPNARGWRGNSPDVDTGQEAFLLVLGQGNETLDYLGSLLWREREREREKLIILVLLPGDVRWDLSRLTSHYPGTQTSHTSPPRDTSSLRAAKGRMIYWKAVNIIIKAGIRTLSPCWKLSKTPFSIRLTLT